MEGVGEPMMGVFMGGEGYMASSADSLSDSVMGARILVTAAKSMGGGAVTTSSSSASVAGVGFGTEGPPSDWEPREVTFVMVAAAIAMLERFVS
jgi:hypothetical protein